MDYMAVWGVNLEMDITPGATPTWVEVGAGFDNLTEALNEVINQYQYLNKNGFGESEVTGMQPIWTLTGVRKMADAAQNYMFSKKYKLLNERKTNFRINYLDENDQMINVLFENVTIANMQEFGGAATDGAAITVEIHTSGEPVVTGNEQIELLSVVSLAGTSAGDTVVYVNPTIEGGNIYKIQTLSEVSIPSYGQDMTALTTWNGTDEITAATGQEVLVVECTAASLARKAGKATVTSA